MGRFARQTLVAYLVTLISAVLGATAFAAPEPTPALRTYMVKGAVEQVQAERNTVIVRHDAISNYMDAMTMPFKVKDAKEVAGLQKDDFITFRLQVTDSESWIDRITRLRASKPGVAEEV